MEVDSSIILSPALTSHAMATKLDLQLNLGDNSNPVVDQDDPENISQPEEEDEIGDCDFSFACVEACSPISADDLFDNGQIKPIFPWPVADPLNLGEEELRLIPVKVFVERSDLPSCSQAEDVAEGPYCDWSKRTASAGESSSAAPESCRKSNSTGFSKLRRFRDLLHRSQSDGKDTFVFLMRSEKEETTSLPSKKTNSNNKGKKKDKAGEAESKTTSSSSTKSKTTPSLSSYALQYGEKGKEKRKSYLPYRQDLVGFFTNANAMSKNIHPY